MMERLVDWQAIKKKMRMDGSIVICKQDDAKKEVNDVHDVMLGFLDEVKSFFHHLIINPSHPLSFAFTCNLSHPSFF